MHIEIRLKGKPNPINYFKAEGQVDGGAYCVSFIQKDGREVTHLYPLVHIYRVREVDDLPDSDQGIAVVGDLRQGVDADQYAAEHGIDLSEPIPTPAKGA